MVFHNMQKNNYSKNWIQYIKFKKLVVFFWKIIFTAPKLIWDALSLPQVSFLCTLSQIWNNNLNRMHLTFKNYRINTLFSIDLSVNILLILQFRFILKMWTHFDIFQLSWLIRANFIHDEKCMYKIVCSVKFM